MSIINNVKEVLHRIRVKLYPNYLPGVEGKYIARTVSEAVLSTEDVCAAMQNRGGFAGNYQDLVDNVKQYHVEAVYQLLDGFAVSNEYYSVHPNIGGTFDSENEAHDHKKHPVAFRYRTLQKLRVLAGEIAVEIEGLADVQGYIAEFLDVSTEAVNETATPGRQFVITGYKVKVAGDSPDTGVYFISVSNGREIKTAEHLAENSPSKLIGVIPQLPVGVYKAVIKTRFSSGSFLLKEPRVIESGFTLTMA
jgi:hypothetical protein